MKNLTRLETLDKALQAACEDRDWVISRIIELQRPAAYRMTPPYDAVLNAEGVERGELFRDLPVALQNVTYYSRLIDALLAARPTAR